MVGSRNWFGLDVHFRGKCGIVFGKSVGGLRRGEGGAGVTVPIRRLIEKAPRENSARAPEPVRVGRRSGKSGKGSGTGCLAGSGRRNIGAWVKNG